MKIKIVFYVPARLTDIDEVKRVNKLLTKTKISNEIKIMSGVDEEKLKFDILIPLAVLKRIKIKQTRKSKILYPQLIVFVENKPLTFYPQSYGNKEVNIEDFLEALLDNKILCLHDAPELEEFVK